MLYKLLTLIHTREYQSHQDLALALQVPPGLILIMAHDLVQKGILKPLSACIPDEGLSNCNDCSTHNGCLLSGNRNGWMLTEKGERLVGSALS